MTATKKRGRPKGAKTVQRDVVTVEPTRCRVCGSTDRDPYRATRRLPHSGFTPAGELYTTVVWRHTKCRHCGQARVDQTFENRPN